MTEKIEPESSEDDVSSSCGGNKLRKVKFNLTWKMKTS